MNSLPSQLDTVLALSDMAQSGPWTTITGDLLCDAFGHGVAACVDGMEADNAAFIAAACNFIREHGPAIRAAVGGEAVAWRYMRQWSDGSSGWTRWLGVEDDVPCHYDQDGKRIKGPHPDWKIEYAYASPTATVDVGALSNDQVAEFLAVAFRHVEIVGDIHYDDIRMGLRRAALIEEKA